MRTYHYAAPKSLQNLFELLDTIDSKELKIIAGGTDYVPRMNVEYNSVPTGNETPLTLVYIGNLPLNEIKMKGSLVSIGATATLNEVMDSPLIKEKLPALSATMHEMAGLTIRNTGTIGGNVMNASPAADSVPMLLVLEADMVLLSKNGERIVPAAEFFTGPGRTVAVAGEILSEIRIHVGAGHASFKKLGRRAAETLSVVNAAAYIEMAGDKCYKARIALGSVGPKAIRCLMLEQDLDNKVLTPELIKTLTKNIVNEICPIDDIRSSAWYRNKTAPVMAARAIMEAAGMKEEDC